MKFILKHMHEGQSKIAYNAQNTNEIYTGPIYTNACRTQMQETCSNRTKPNQNTPGITELSNDADDALFQRVLYRPNRVGYSSVCSEIANQINSACATDHMLKNSSKITEIEQLPFSDKTVIQSHFTVQQLLSLTYCCVLSTFTFC